METGPQAIDVLRLFELRAAGVEVPIFALEYRIIQHQVLHARLRKDRHTSRLRRPYDVRAFTR